MQALSITDLTKTYASGTKALKSISFNVAPGDFFALLGPNGAGKSTTIGIIASLVNKTSGKVKIFDYDLDTQLEFAKTQIGLVPQEFNFSIFEKVIDIVISQAGYYGVPRRIAKERAEFSLKKLGLWEKNQQTAGSLSGGMKRRLMIARALAHQPKLLILDEPTAGVDIEIRRSMWEFLREINQQGTTIILTTHYLEEAENLCKNIAIIDKGQIVENTTMKSLLAKLNTETFILDVKNVLHSLPNNTYFPMHLVDEQTLEVSLKRGQTLNELFNLLREYKIEITSMRNKANRLEELFLDLIAENNKERI